MTNLRPGPSQPRSAAFFDLDRTMIPGSSLKALAMPLHRAGLLHVWPLVSAWFRNREFSKNGYDKAEIEAAARALGAMVRGADAERLASAGRALVPRVIVPRIFPEIQELLAHHRARGDLIFIVSSAPQEIVDPLCKAIGATWYAATVAEVVDGRYTGAITTFMHAENKGEAVRQLASAYDVDLTTSTAYADAGSDVFMLEAVGNPVCVNADAELSAIADARHWPRRNFDRPPHLPWPQRFELRRLALSLRHQVQAAATPDVRGL